MTKEQFIAQYILVFMATWTAKEYNDACLYSRQKSLEKQPIEDAEYLAKIAWNIYQEHQS
jgi:hypothetical protein